MPNYQFTEDQTRAHYAKVDNLCRSFWDQEGSLHWGYFDNPESTEINADDFLPACQRWNKRMLSKAGLSDNSYMLDVGCGNGNTVLWLALRTACRVVGIDLSLDRVENAQAALAKHNNLRVEFRHGSATKIPYDDNEFTHVWSQATLYHVHNRKQALKEIYRVLQPGGTFIFDDLVTPVAIDKLSPFADKYVYQRMLFKPLFSGASYAEFLQEVGFKVLEKEDLSRHLKKSYELLAQKAERNKQKLLSIYKESGLDEKSYIDPTVSFLKVCQAIENQELGWYFYLCTK